MVTTPANESKRAGKATAGQDRTQKNADRRAEITARLGRMAYSVEEVAATLDIDPTTIWRLVKSGEIPSVKFGGSRRIPAAWLKGRLAGQDTQG